MHTRAFPYHVTRSGSFSRYRFPLSCSKCGYEKEFEAPKIFPDSVVQKRFSQWGWVIGRNRSNDVCPRCLGVKAANHLANKYKVTHNGNPVMTPAEIAAVFVKTPEPILILEEVVIVSEPEPEPVVIGVQEVVEELRLLRETIEKVALLLIPTPKVKKAPVTKTRAEKAVAKKPRALKRA